MSSNRAELKKLIFEKNRALKQCKTKAERVDVELKYKELQGAFMPNEVEAEHEMGASTPRIEVDCKLKYIQRRETKLAKQKQREAEIRDLVGDGTAELVLQAEEMSEITKRLAEIGRCLNEVEPDGDCLFASLNIDRDNVRVKISDYLLQNRDEFEPFIDIPFEEYCDLIRTSLWGSDIELEIVSRIYQKCIKVITHDRIITFGPCFGDIVYISYHERQYTSPHYNSTSSIV